MARTNQHWSEYVIHISQGVDRSPGSNPASDAILYRRVVDFPGNVNADGKHHDTFTITFSDIQAAWSKDGHTDALPATVKLVAWGSDGMPDNANMTITAITTALGVPIMLNNIFHSSLPNDLTMCQAVSDGLIVNIFKY